MKVEAHDVLVENLFKKGKFIIPDYQREFDWDDENIEELLEDIDETPINENYFIGHMVFEGAFNDFEFKVIDGQQRITTLTILLCAIRDRFYKLEEIKLADAVHTFIFGKDKNFEDFAILENKMPYPILQSYVQSKPDKKDLSKKPVKTGEKKIIHAYDAIYKYLEAFDKDSLVILRDKVLKLEVIFVAASDRVDASTIFMTLNATGKDLLPIDLVKNYIFNLYPRLPHIDEPNDTWKNIIENSEGSAKFLNNFFASRYRKVSDKNIFKYFLKVIKTEGKEKIKDFLENLKKDAQLFRQITKPKSEDWGKNDYDIYESLYAITVVFKIGVANSLLISLIREFKNNNITKDYLLKALNQVERFHFINNAVCSFRSSGFDTMYAKKSRQLFEAQDKEKKHRRLNELISELEKKIPPKEAFEANFDKRLFFSKNQTKQKLLVQYALNKIERKINKNSILISTSIEHIYPETRGDWPKINNEGLIPSLGNLVLLDTGLNSFIGNKLYKVKKNKIVKESKIISTQNVFSRNEDWSDSEIIERNKLLVEELYLDIWK
jgi:uncharacterized protein with ParB-like and HNH nuclease domain